jgi:hypothetical protein
MMLQRFDDGKLHERVARFLHFVDVEVGLQAGM